MCFQITGELLAREEELSEIKEMTTKRDLVDMTAEKYLLDHETVNQG